MFEKTTRRDAIEDQAALWRRLVCDPCNVGLAGPRAALDREGRMGERSRGGAMQLGHGRRGESRVGARLCQSAVPTLFAAFNPLFLAETSLFPVSSIVA